MGLFSAWGDCRFENTITGQIVEVIVTSMPEFGLLDGYFFYTYISITRRYQPLAAALGHSHINICKAIELLAAKGVLSRWPHTNDRRNIIAL